MRYSSVACRSGARLFFAVLLASALGCAVFPGGKIPPTELPPVSGGAQSKPSVAYSILARGGFGTPAVLSDPVQQVIAGELLQTLEESGYFSRISKVDEEADVKLDVSITNTGNAGALIFAFITGASFYTIPSWATDRFDVVAKVSARDGGAREYTLADQATLVQWLPMIFFFPTNNFAAVPETRRNMYRSLLAQMQRDGLLQG